MLAKTTRQIMFYQLGYYDGNFDGIWGKGSKNATKEFQKDYGLEVDGIYGVKTEAKLIEVYNKFINGLMSDKDWNNIKYFAKWEIDCNCGCGYDEVYKQLIYNFDALRHHLGVSMTITSGGRCKKYNKKVGGVTNSKHYNNEKGIKAFDFASKKTNTKSKRKNVINFWVKYMPNARYGYCDGYSNNQGTKGVYKNPNMGNATHLDIK